MPLVLKVMMLDTESGARGESSVDLRPDAVRLTRPSFLDKYCGPAIAIAWDEMAKDHAKRAFESEAALNAAAAINSAVNS